MLADERRDSCWSRAPARNFIDMSLGDPNADLPGIGAGIWNVSFVALMQELTAAIRKLAVQLAWGATFADGHQCQIA